MFVLLEVFARLLVLGGLGYLAVMGRAIWEYELRTPESPAAVQGVESLELDLERAA